MTAQLRIAVRNPTLRKLSCDARGLSTVEYVIILVLIAASAIGIWSTFGNTIKGKIKIADDQVRSLSVK